MPADTFAATPNRRGRVNYLSHEYGGQRQGTPVSCRHVSFVVQSVEAEGKIEIPKGFGTQHVYYMFAQSSRERWPPRVHYPLCVYPHHGAVGDYASSAGTLFDLYQSRLQVYYLPWPCILRGSGDHSGTPLVNTLTSKPMLALEFRRYLPACSCILRKTGYHAGTILDREYPCREAGDTTRASQVGYLPTDTFSFKPNGGGGKLMGQYLGSN